MRLRGRKWPEGGGSEGSGKRVVSLRSRRGRKKGRKWLDKGEGWEGRRCWIRERHTGKGEMKIKEARPKEETTLKR